jgi:hypothetical protein
MDFFGNPTVGASLTGSFDEFPFEAEDTEGIGSCALVSSSTASSLKSANIRLRKENSQTTTRNNKN